MNNPKVTYEVGHEDLSLVVENIVKSMNQNAFDKFYNVFIDGQAAAQILTISPRTLTRYINDGILTPDSGVKKYQFRLSEVLKIDLTNIKYKRKS